MSPRLRRRLAIVWRAFLALAALILTGVVAGNQLQAIHLGSEGQRWIATLALAGVTCIDNIRIAIVRGRVPARPSSRAAAQRAVVTALLEIADASGLKFQDLGASALVPHRRIVRLEGERLPRLRLPLVRVLRFRVQDATQLSKVTWTAGKGAIGQSWQMRRQVHRQWAGVRTEHGHQALTQEEFLKIPEAQRDGLEFREFTSIAPKYDEILAVPIVSEDGATVGVLSIEVLAGRETGDIFSKPDTITPAVAAAAFVRDHLGSLYAQS